MSERLRASRFERARALRVVAEGSLLTLGWKVLRGQWWTAANAGSFDCVRLAPHFAQDDRGYKRGDRRCRRDDRGWKAEIVPQLRNRRGQNRLGRTGEGGCAYVGCAEDSAAFLIWGDNGET